MRRVEELQLEAKNVTSEMQRVIDSQVSVIGQLRETLSEKTGLLVEARDRQDKLETFLEQEKVSARKISDRQEKLESLLEQERASAKKLSDRLEEQFTVGHDRQGNLEGLLEQEKASVKKLSERLEEQCKEIKTLQDEAASKATLLGERKVALQMIQSKLDEKTSLLEKAAKELEDFKTKTDAQMSELRTELWDATGSVTPLMNARNEILVELEDLDQENKRFKNQIEEQNRDIFKLKENLLREKEEHADQVQDLKAELKDALQKLQTAEMTLHDRATTEKTRQESMTTIAVCTEEQWGQSTVRQQQKLAQMELDAEALQGEIEELKKAVADGGGREEKLEQELRKAIAGGSVRVHEVEQELGTDVASSVRERDLEQKLEAAYRSYSEDMKRMQAEADNRRKSRDAKIIELETAKVELERRLEEVSSQRLKGIGSDRLSEVVDSPVQHDQLQETATEPPSTDTGADGNVESNEAVAGDARLYAIPSTPVNVKKAASKRRFKKELDALEGEVSLSSKRNRETRSMSRRV